jgi:hypothetical protein
MFLAEILRWHHVGEQIMQDFQILQNKVVRKDRDLAIPIYLSSDMALRNMSNSKKFLRASTRLQAV